MKPFVILCLLLLTSSHAVATEPKTKRDLAKAVLLELGVASRFDVYLTRGADQATGGQIQNTKLHQWQQNLWIQELGWRTAEDAYISHFESKFSEKELIELLTLAKNPLIRKLINEELAAFRATFDARNKTFGVFWQRFNSFEFAPPEDVFK